MGYNSDTVNGFATGRFGLRYRHLWPHRSERSFSMMMYIFGGGGVFTLGRHQLDWLDKYAVNF